jgi:dTDP-4-dehydrorhamnose 3,5-epimerase
MDHKPFIIEETELEGVRLITPKVINDTRGSFHQLFQDSQYRAYGIPKFTIKQVNLSTSKKWAFRGFHFQEQPEWQGKLATVVGWSVADIVICLNEESPSYWKRQEFKLSADNKKMLYIPPRYAHGFLALEGWTNFLYMCDEEYKPLMERCITKNDKIFNGYIEEIAWKYGIKNLIISDKDKNGISWEEFEKNIWSQGYPTSP